MSTGTSGGEVRADPAPGSDRTGRTPALHHKARIHRRAQGTTLLLIGSAGAVGALARYAMSQVIASPTGHFVWSTFFINTTGSFAIGLVLVLLTERFPRARLARPLIVTGFLGAYTTFSTYTVDTDLLLRNHDFTTGTLYALSSLFAGLAATFLGVVLARVIVGNDRRLKGQPS